MSGWCTFSGYCVECETERDMFELPPAIAGASVLSRYCGACCRVYYKGMMPADAFGTGATYYNGRLVGSREEMAEEAE